MYEHEVAVKSKRRWPKILLIILAVAALLVGGYFVYDEFFREPTVEEKISFNLEFDSSVAAEEQAKINQAVSEQAIVINSSVTANAFTAGSLVTPVLQLGAYVPVTNSLAIRQKVTGAELAKLDVAIVSGTDPVIKSSFTEHLQLGAEKLKDYSGELKDIPETLIVFIPAEQLSSDLKLLWLDEKYYLDDFLGGALFREVGFDGEGANDLANLDLKFALSEESVFSVNMSGVTALTRQMMKKLAIIKDPQYFSAKIGEFLADADLTHVSNEVSFKENCAYSYTLFCSPPEFIETLKASGVDLVELTGNHNNDLGSQYNTATINQYHELGWATVGGGLNTEEAAKPHIADEKGSKVAFLAYNYPDSPNGGAIAGAAKAGANPFDFTYESIQTDITAAKQSADFVIVNIQFWECYSYPNGYVEYPICDKPIADQEETFKKMIELGADMVIGSSAHQPQTYVKHQDKWVFYGLGNMYFEQTQWPGTERGIILTHYFAGGKLLQTKLTPTVYDTDLQTRVMTDTEAEYLLTRLHNAR